MTSGKNWFDVIWETSYTPMGTLRPANERLALFSTLPLEIDSEQVYRFPDAEPEWLTPMTPQPPQGQPPPKPQPMRPGTAACSIIDRMNKSEPFVEVDVLPGEEKGPVTYRTIIRAVEREAAVRLASTHPDTRLMAPKNWKIKDLDVGLKSFNSDGSVTFVVGLRYKSGDYW